MFSYLSKFLLLIALINLFSCASIGVTRSNFDRIDYGMSEQQVIAILGEPTKSTTVGGSTFGLGTIFGADTVSGTNMLWQTPMGTLITIQFVNSKVRLKTFTNQL
ncbi:MAG: hypothetical protein BWK79_02715 [Beggiatoa sp. IS2]|nr:MAG: hypothetical protein BWK79_02715 [Beggiatoa sp. IS2]